MSKIPLVNDFDGHVGTHISICGLAGRVGIVESEMGLDTVT